MRRIGFTGTRNGMTDAQKVTVARKFAEWVCLHHGDCVGADADAHAIAERLGMEIIIHPPIDNKLRAYCKAPVILSPATHFARNRNIVNGTDGLIATPRLMVREERGGTWYTIDYAVKVGKPAWIVWPDGSCAHQNPKLVVSR